MSQLDSGKTIRRARPTPNVYTVLVVIATLMLLGSAAFMYAKNIELTQGNFPGAQGKQSNPFYIIAKP